MQQAITFEFKQLKQLTVEVQNLCFSHMYEKRALIQIRGEFLCYITREISPEWGVE